jgi:hypothetical protein
MDFLGFLAGRVHIRMGRNLDGIFLKKVFATRCKPMSLFGHGLNRVRSKYEHGFDGSDLTHPDIFITLLL